MTSSPNPVPDPVQAALDDLELVTALPIDERPPAFHAIHETLRAALAEIDDA